MTEPFGPLLADRAAPGPPRRALALVIDDCRMSSLLLRHILAREGVASESAASGEEGLERALRGGYRLILLDVRLPGIDGVEVLRRLREAPLEPPPKIFLLTAHGEHFRPEEVEALGADGIFFKPVVPSEIARLGREVCGSAPASRPAGEPAGSGTGEGGAPKSGRQEEKEPDETGVEKCRNERREQGLDQAGEGKSHVVKLLSQGLTPLRREERQGVCPEEHSDTSR